MNEVFYNFIHMAVDNQHIFDSGLYFLTFTNYKWLPLLEVTRSYDLVYKWFDILKSNGHQIVGYVTMPNHLHALIGFYPGKKSINTIVGNGKRFIAYDIVKRLEEAQKVDLLKTLSDGVSASDKRKGKLHELYEGTFDLKLCHSYKFVKQKLDYMHANPVIKKWNLAINATDYIHSSAKFYETGEPGVYEVTHANDWMYKNWDSAWLEEATCK